jgi:adenylate cyclase
MFTDIKSFTVFSSTITPDELVAVLNVMFSAFDRIADRYGVHKVCVCWCVCVCVRVCVRV